MREENQTIIKALNMFSRVPETWELLNEIERLNNIIDELEKKLNITYKELMPNELVNGRNLIKNIQIDLKELKEGKE